jgi:hypothetical protein
MNLTRLRTLFCLITLAIIGNLTAVVLPQGYSIQLGPADFHQNQGGNIQGQVYGYTCLNTLEPIVSAKITMTSAGSQFSTVTGPDGTYTFFLPLGTYNLTVAAGPEYQPQSQVVTLANGQSLKVDFSLKRSASAPKICSLNVGMAYLQISTNSSITNLQFDSQRKLINFTVSAHIGTTGLTAVTFAKSLISGVPTVLVDNGNTQLISYALESNSTHYYLTITYPQSLTHSITIGGSNTIPEFDRNAILPLLVLMTFGSLVIVRLRRWQSELITF